MRSKEQIFIKLKVPKQERVAINQQEEPPNIRAIECNWPAGMEFDLLKLRYCYLRCYFDNACSDEFRQLVWTKIYECLEHKYKSSFTIVDLIARVAEIESTVTICRRHYSITGQPRPIKLQVYEKYVEAPYKNLLSDDVFVKPVVALQNSCEWTESMSSILLRLRLFQSGSSCFKITGWLEHPQSWTYIVREFQKCNYQGRSNIIFLRKQYEYLTNTYEDGLSQLSKTESIVYINVSWLEYHHVYLNSLKAFYSPFKVAERFLNGQFRLDLDDNGASSISESVNVPPLHRPLDANRTSSTEECDKWSEAVLIEITRLRILKYGVHFEVEPDQPYLYEKIAAELESSFPFQFSSTAVIQVLSILKNHYLEGLKALDCGSVEDESELPVSWRRLHEVFKTRSEGWQEQLIDNAKILHMMYT